MVGGRVAVEGRSLRGGRSRAKNEKRSPPTQTNLRHVRGLTVKGVHVAVCRRDKVCLRGNNVDGARAERDRVARHVHHERREVGIGEVRVEAPNVRPRVRHVEGLDHDGRVQPRLREGKMARQWGSAGESRAGSRLPPQRWLTAVANVGVEPRWRDRPDEV